MSKVLCIKDANINYDLAIPLRKNYISEELEKIGFTALEELLAKYNEKDVKDVLLTGEVFSEETLMVEEMDRFISMLSGYEGYQFIIAPGEIVSEDSWYNIVNWPENCHLLLSKGDSYTDQESQIHFCIEAVSDNAEAETVVTIEGDASWNKDLGSFFPKDYTLTREESVALYDPISDEVIYDENVWIILKKIEITINTEMDVHRIYDLINQSIHRDLDEKCFYQCELKGKVSKELEKDLVNLIKEQLNNEVECLFVNNTFKDYNIEKIKKANKDNLVGLFIENVMNSQREQDECQRIVQIGLDYLI